MDRKINAEESGKWQKFKANFMKDITFEQRLQLKKDLRDTWHGKNSYEAEKKVIYSLEKYVKGATNKLEDSNKQLLLNTKERSNELVSRNDIITTSLVNIERYLEPKNENIQNFCGFVGDYSFGFGKGTLRDSSCSR